MPAVTRRDTLKKLGAGAVGTVWGVSEARGGTQSNTLTVTKQGARDGVARYEVTVTGELEPTDDFEDHGTDDITGRTATGRIGPARGLDRLRYSGRITGFSLTGPAVVYRNGQRVDPRDLGDGRGGGGGSRLPNTLEIRKADTPEGVADYEFMVSGEVEATDAVEDHGTDNVGGFSASGRIGPRRGLDRFRFSGDVTHFCFGGPARVYLNGVEYRDRELAGRCIWPGPSRTITITKDGARDGVARYEIGVTAGSIAPTDDFEDHGTDDLSDDRRTANGRVGPRRGRDQLRYSGWIDEFDLYGPAVVYVNGKERDPYLLGS